MKIIFELSLQIGNSEITPICLLFLFYFTRIMSNDIEIPNLDNLTCLIRIIRQRQQLYFSILSFISKNIQSSSNKLDQIGLFNRFLNQVKEEQAIIKLQEQQLQNMFRIHTNDPQQNFHMRKNVRQITRLTNRLLQMLQTSMQKSLHSFLNNSEKLQIQFVRFKNMLFRITTAQIINIKTFITTLLNYSKNKFNRQIFKIQKYLIKLESGQPVNLRDMFNKDGSDIQCPEEDNKQIKNKQQTLNIKQRGFTQKQSDKNKAKPPKSLKKGGTNRLSLLKKKGQLTKKDIIKQQRENQSSVANEKSKTASKLYKFYHLLELNKKQFMQDFIFEEQQKQAKARQLMSSLLQRNKTIQGHINVYTDKTQRYMKTIAESPLVPFKLLERNEVDDKEIQNTIIKTQSATNSFKISMRKSFMISKRKSSINIQNPSSSGNSDNESSVCTFFSKTSNKINSNGKISLSKSHNKTNRMYIVKAPMLFEQQIIPQNAIHHTGRKDIYSLLKGKEKKNENMRMRRRHNPIPMQKSSLMQTFRYQQKQK